MSPAATKIWQKSLKSYILTPPNPQEHGMSVKCEGPIDELTVQVLLLYHHSNFKYCTLFCNGMELRTNRRTIRLLDAPNVPFMSGAYSLRESLKFLQDRRSGLSRYFTRPYTILPDRQILSHDSQLDTRANGPHQLLQSQDDIGSSKGL